MDNDTVLDNEPYNMNMYSWRNTMKNSIAILIPSEYESGIRAAKFKFARNFGGYTATRHTGGWIDQYQQLIEEDVTSVLSYTDNEIEIEKIKEFAIGVGYICEQHSVAIIHNNEMIILEIPRKKYQTHTDKEFICPII